MSSAVLSANVLEDRVMNEMLTSMTVIAAVDISESPASIANNPELSKESSVIIVASVPQLARPEKSSIMSTQVVSPAQPMIDTAAIDAWLLRVSTSMDEIGKLKSGARYSSADDILVDIVDTSPILFSDMANLPHSYQGAVMKLAYEVADVKFNLADYSGSKKCFDRILCAQIKVCERLEADGQASFEALLNVSTTYRSLGVWHSHQAEYQIAKEQFDKAMAILDKINDNDLSIDKSFMVVQLLMDFSMLTLQQGQYSQTMSNLETLKNYLMQQNIELDASTQSEFLTMEAALLFTKGELTQALTSYNDALELRRSAYGASHPKVAESMKNLAMIYFYACDYGEARGLLLESLEIEREFYLESHPIIALSLFYKAQLSMAIGKIAESLALFQRVQGIRKNKFNANHPLMGQCSFGLAEYYRVIGMPTEASAYYLTALNSYRISEISNTHEELLKCMCNNALNTQLMGRYNDAVKLFEETLLYRRQQAEMFGVAIQPEEEICKLRLGYVFVLLNRFGDAKPFISQSGKHLSKMLGRRHLLVVEAVFILGEYWKVRGKYINGKTAFCRCVSLVKDISGEQSYLQTTYLNSLSEDVRLPGYFEESADYCNQSVQLCIDFFGEQSIHMASALYNRAQILRDMGFLAEATAVYEQAMNIVVKGVGEDCTHYAMLLGDLGECLRILSRFDEAEPMLLRALNARISMFGNEHAAVGEVLCSIAILMIDTNRFDQAEQKLSEEVIPLFSTILGLGHPWTMYAKGNLGLCLKYCPPVLPVNDSDNLAESLLQPIVVDRLAGQTLINGSLEFFDMYKHFPFAEDHPWVLRFGGFDVFRLGSADSRADMATRDMLLRRQRNTLTPEDGMSAATFEMSILHGGGGSGAGGGGSRSGMMILEDEGGGEAGVDPVLRVDSLSTGSNLMVGAYTRPVTAALDDMTVASSVMEAPQFGDRVFVDGGNSVCSALSEQDSLQALTTQDAPTIEDTIEDANKEIST